MRRTFTAALVALVLSPFRAAPVAAGQFEDGKAAYDGGDYATALRLWRPLADQGVPDALVNLALMYLKGQGVPQDNVQALKWFTLAAGASSESEDPDLLAAAVKIRDLLGAKMTPEQIAEAQKLAREWKPNPYDYPHPKDAGGKPK
jgi:TPR repeat protein